MSNEELAQAIKTGERDKLLSLWEQVRRFVYQQARRWAAYGGVETDDLSRTQAGGSFPGLFSGGSVGLSEDKKKGRRNSGPLWLSLYKFGHTIKFKVKPCPSDHSICAQVINHISAKIIGVYIFRA